LASEKRALSPADGRRLKSAGRSVQLNLRVRPEFKEQLYEFAQSSGLTMAEVIERAVEAFVGGARKSGSTS
jgi:hypothetical protein